MTDDPTAQYLVLVNHERQYSLWQVGIDVPNGWKTVFGPDSKDACTAYVDKEWTDMRPLSLRQQMDETS